MESDPFSLDWELLASISKEWTAIRSQFGLGSKATEEQIEAVWDGIFKPDKTAWPYLRRLLGEIMQAPLLTRRLLHCWWKKLAAWERRGYEWEEVHPGVVLRLWSQVARNACEWLKKRGVHNAWTPWSNQTLTTELRRAINTMWLQEDGQEEGLPANLQVPSKHSS